MIVKICQEVESIITDFWQILYQTQAFDRAYQQEERSVFIVIDDQLKYLIDQVKCAVEKEKIFVGMLLFHGHCYYIR